MAPSKPKTKKTTGPYAMAEAMSGFNPATAAVWRDIMAESAQFMADRLQKDLETQKAMLNCKSPADLLRLQTAFFQDALSDYTEEATRMLKLMSKTGGTSRDYDDVPV